MTSQEVCCVCLEQMPSMKLIKDGVCTAGICRECFPNLTSDKCPNCKTLYPMIKASCNELQKGKEMWANMFEELFNNWYEESNKIKQLAARYTWSPEVKEILQRVEKIGNV